MACVFERAAGCFLSEASVSGAAADHAIGIDAVHRFGQHAGENQGKYLAAIGSAGRITDKICHVAQYGVFGF